VNSYMLKSIANSAPNYLKIPNFCASNGWLSMFLKRHNFTRRKRTHQTQILNEILTIEARSYIDAIAFLDKSDQIFLNIEKNHISYDKATEYILQFKGDQSIEILTHNLNKSISIRNACSFFYRSISSTIYSPRL
jgi:Tc5 transposase DNA-binding domain